MDYAAELEQGRKDAGVNGTRGQGRRVRQGKEGSTRVTFSHLRVLVTMILLDEAAGTIVKAFPRVACGIFERSRNDLNRAYPTRRDRPL